MPTTIPGTFILQSPTANDPLLDMNTQPSLDLQFSTAKTLDDRVSGLPLVDHQRDASGSNSPGTYIGSDGLIKTSKVNLLTRSQDFDQWTIGANSTVTSNATVAPDGSMTAYRIQMPATATTFVGNGSVSANTTYTMSVYAKAVTPGTNDTFTFNLGGGNDNASPQLTATNEWQRFTFTLTPSTVTATPLAYLNNQDDTFASDIYFWGAQLETGSTATTYIPTTNLPSAAPRFDHNPATGESLGLLVEESRTNILANSETFSDWNTSTTTRQSNAGISPSGSNDAIKLVADATSGGKLFYRNITTTANNVVSIYAKAGEHTNIQIRELSTARFYVNFNLSSGTTVLTGGPDFVSADIQEAGNGWYRCIVENSTVGGLALCVSGYPDSVTVTSNPPNFVGDGTSGVYLWGPQVEEGSFPTSYIPTSGSTVTRAADVASITGTNFSRWYNQSEGTMFSDVTAYSGSLWRAGLVMDTALGATTILQVLHEESQDRLTHAGSLKAITPNVPTGQQFKSVWSTEGTSLFAASNGSSVVTLAQAPTQTMNGLGVGSLLGVAGTFGNGHISRLAYYPYRLGDTTLQDITS